MELELDDLKLKLKIDALESKMALMEVEINILRLWLGLISELKSSETGL
jgi:hypothetical protein